MYFHVGTQKLPVSYETLSYGWIQIDDYVFTLLSKITLFSRDSATKKELSQPSD